MNFESIEIKNFRNFKNIKVNLANKNIFFGMNDVGKTNFLYALRFLFDKDIRKQGFLDSDFYTKNTDIPIEILIELDINDIHDDDNQILRAKLKGNLASDDSKVYIKLIAEYNNNDSLAIPTLFWGGKISNLYEIKQSGYYCDLDRIFNVIYIDSYINLNSLFKKNLKKLITSDSDENDNRIKNEIDNLIDKLNNKISELSDIDYIENELTPIYNGFRDEDISISIKSEIAVNGLYSNLIPYIKQSDSDKLYPTSGEGRKKILVYSIFDMLYKKTAETKINLFLIEEPENHLHRSMQLSLSQTLFTDNRYKYLFVTTHSPYVLYEMDNVNLIRIFCDREITSKSVFYQVPKNYEKTRKMLNESLSEAIFADKVLLVEGPSEYLLFNKILSIIFPYYETKGIYILYVNGIKFKDYLSVLKSLNIKSIVKTDNDLRSKKDSSYSVLGFSRVNGLTENKLLPTNPIESNSIESKRELYNSKKDIIDAIRKEYKVYLSKVDLENDLDECMHERLVNLLSTETPVKYLQDSKQYNMIELINILTNEDCTTIYNHYNFECLKELI